MRDDTPDHQPLDQSPNDTSVVEPVRVIARDEKVDVARVR